MTRGRLSSLALLAGLVLAAAGAAAAPADHGPPERVRVIVKLHAPTFVTEGALGPDVAVRHRQRAGIAVLQDALVAAMTGTPSRVLWRYATSPYIALEVGADGLQALATSPLVEVVGQDLRLKTQLAQSGPLVQADAARQLGFSGSGEHVVVIDTGVDRAHVFLGGRVVEEWCFVSPNGCPNGASQQNGPGAAAPVGSHGTHVAGIAAGSGATFSGVAPGAAVIAMRVFSEAEVAYTSDIKAALDRVIVMKDSLAIAAVNMSLGSDYASTGACDADDGGFLKTDIDTLRSAGIATVVATGNESRTTQIAYPACISSTIKVTATTDSDAFAWFANRSPTLESTTLAAPGYGICSSVPASSDYPVCADAGTGGYFGDAYGTSMATPHVAGAFAVLKQAKPSASVDEMLAALRSTAVAVVDGATGTTYRRIRVAAAVSALLRATGLTPDRPSPQPPGTTITFTAGVTGGTQPYSYKWFVWNGTSWSVVQNWSANATYTWTPAVAGDYTIVFWVRSAGNTADAAEAWTLAHYTVESGPPLRATGLTADKPSPQAVGTTITFTAALTGGTPPYAYKWFVWNGSSWSVVQDWSASATYAWTPAAAGANDMVVFWARSSGNTADSPEAWQLMPYVVEPPSPLRVTGLTADKPSPQAVGTTITFTAALTGGTPPYAYKWFVWNGSSWSIVQDWSASATYAWTPAAAGADDMVVFWARSAGNAADSPEAWQLMQYVVQSP